MPTNPNLYCRVAIADSFAPTGAIRFVIDSFPPLKRWAIVAMSLTGQGHLKTEFLARIWRRRLSP